MKSIFCTLNQHGEGPQVYIRMTLVATLSDVGNCALKDGKQQSCRQAEKPWNIRKGKLLHLLSGFHFSWCRYCLFATWVNYLLLLWVCFAFPRLCGKTGMNFFGQPVYAADCFLSTGLPQRGSPVWGGVALTLYERWQICLPLFRCLAGC